MLTGIRIQGYKCIDHCDLPLAPLTVLAGPNSSGKSTLLQAILLLFSGLKHQNGPALNEVVKPFSQFEEVYCRYSNAQEIKIMVEAEAWRCKAVMDREGLKAQVLKKEGKRLAYEENFFYLCAGRSGPEEISAFDKTLRIGQHGQFAIGLLELLKDKPVHPSLICPQAHANTLKAQLAWWLSFIIGLETEARTEKISATAVKTSFEEQGIGSVSPFNTGAGSSFLLKLLVMCLTAKPGDLLLIENPEIHLHPGAQSRLGSLLAFLAANGVQAIVETHCEHLANRLRYEIYTRKLDAKDAVIHYKPGFQEPFETLLINQRGHFCDQDGNEKPFPAGFFDSTLAELLEIG
jgi:predicted ATPase